MVCRGYWHFNGAVRVLVTKGAFGLSRLRAAVQRRLSNCIDSYGEVLDVFNVVGSGVKWSGKRTLGGTVMIVGSHIIIYSRIRRPTAPFFVKFLDYRMLMRAVVG